jgi:elongation factor P--(R)-beta-lysine ligase
MAHWQPTATLETLRYRAKILAQIRQFFEVRDVLEVDVPVLSETAVTDLHIDCLQTQVGGAIQYLQSSPEYFMKRLLASGSGPIYSLGKAFRDGELGRRHHPEFTMLEWYRTSWDECQLIEEVTLLLQELGLDCDVQMLMYGDVFEQVVGLNPHAVPLAQLQQKAGSIAGDDFSNESRSTCLDLIFSLSVEPQLPDGLVFIRNYPACQAALARLGKDEAGNTIARRFEAFLNGVELANGYYELIDPVEQKSRFDADLALRQAEGKPAMFLDTQLLAAMDSGLPSCAGVALGVDRLLMQLLDIGDISHVMPFGHVGNSCE